MAAKRLQIMADKAGYHADVARTAAEVRALLRDRTYAAMTLDLDLSGEDARVPPARVVIFSARDEHQGAGALPYAFLMKSQTTEQRLIDVIQEAVESAA